MTPTRMMLLVCGSRDWTDEDYISDILSNYADKEVTVIHGDARGADRLAAKVAEFHGFDVKAFPADWDKHGKRAGILRNLDMLDEGPDRVIAFQKDGSKGTQHTVDEARRRGIDVTVCTPDVISTYEKAASS